MAKIKNDKYKNSRKFVRLMEIVTGEVFENIRNLEHEAQVRERGEADHMCTPKINLYNILEEHGLIIQDPRSNLTNYLITDRGRKMYNQIEDSFTKPK